ncbi:hypothetical protein JW758_01290 [Candidatus Peregrinibacteria bacterium]|nr:hypothetical protein [Candidatus Peregrinibacteria bacterium]
MLEKILSQIIGNAYAQELIPCEDGSMADPEVGCAKVPDAIINSHSNVTEVALKITESLLSFVVALAIGTLIYGGIRYVMSAGNKNQIGIAKKIIFWSTFGLIVAVIAKYITGFALSIVL